MLNDRHSPGQSEATFRVGRRPDAPDSRRIHDRLLVDLDVTMASDHNFYAGFAENISADGVFIATHQLKPVGARLEFTINLPNVSQSIRGVGEVRWVRVYDDSNHAPPGVGLRFVQLEPGAEQAIQQFMEAREPMFYDDGP